MQLEKFGVLGWLKLPSAKTSSLTKLPLNCITLFPAVIVINLTFKTLTIKNASKPGRVAPVLTVHPHTDAERESLAGTHRTAPRGVTENEN